MNENAPKNGRIKSSDETKRVEHYYKRTMRDGYIFGGKDNAWQNASAYIKNKGLD